MVFNECVDMGKGGEWDKLKAVIADDEYCHEGKGKAMYMREETAAYVFISNWANAVKLGNGDRRYACIEMSQNKLGDRQYFKDLAEACEDPRSQRLWYNYLIRLDLSGWDRRNIPRTNLRT